MQNPRTNCCGSLAENTCSLDRDKTSRSILLLSKMVAGESFTQTILSSCAPQSWLPSSPGPWRVHFAFPITALWPHTGGEGWRSWPGWACASSKGRLGHEPHEGKQVSLTARKHPLPGEECVWFQGIGALELCWMRSNSASPGAPLAVQWQPTALTLRDWAGQDPMACENRSPSSPDPMGEATVCPNWRLKNWQWMKNELFLRLPVPGGGRLDWEAFSRLHVVCLPRRKPCKMCWGRCSGYKSCAV